MRKKTVRLPLFDRTSEIYNELPKEYSSIIFNNILSKSLLNNTLIDELSLYLGKEEIENILNNLEMNIKISQKKKRKVENKTYIKEIKKDNKELSDNEEVFTF